MSLQHWTPPFARLTNLGTSRQCHSCGLHQPRRVCQKTCNLKGSKLDHLITKTHCLAISVVHIPGVDNWKTDCLASPPLGSRVMCSSHWPLKPATSVCAQDQEPSRTGIRCLNSPLLRLISAFLPVQIICLFTRIEQEKMQVIHIASNWPRWTWYTYILRLLSDYPRHLPNRPALLSQGPLFHPASWSLDLTWYWQEHESLESIIPLLKARKVTSRKIIPGNLSSPGVSTGILLCHAIWPSYNQDLTRICP